MNYRDGASVLQVIKRLEKHAEKDQELRLKMESLNQEMTGIKR